MFDNGWFVGFVGHEVEGRLRKHLTVHHSPFNCDSHFQPMDTFRVLFEDKSNVRHLACVFQVNFHEVAGVDFDVLEICSEHSLIQDLSLQGGNVKRVCIHLHLTPQNEVPLLSSGFFIQALSKQAEECFSGMVHQPLCLDQAKYVFQCMGLKGLV